MIRVDRGAEPAALPAARTTALAALAPHGPATRKDLPSSYKIAHDTLWTAHRYKCAYCEHREQSKRNDVEHFRPAAKYWWLAWTWTNLLFACRNCNQSPGKLDKFPLEAGSPRLAYPDDPPGAERALLLDPTIDRPIDHIEFIEDTSRMPSRWIPRPRAGSLRGKATIETCLLDRADLLTLYGAHVEANVAPDLAALAAVIATGETPNVRREWDRFAKRHVAPSSVFAARARDVLATRVSEAVRTQHGLALPEV